MRATLRLARQLLPRRRREEDLPPGQRLVGAFPRFGRDPSSSPPPAGDSPSITVAFDGRDIATVAAADVDAARVDIGADFHCVTTWSVTGLSWSGARFADLWRTWCDHEPQLADAVYVRVHGNDGHGCVMLLEDALADDVLIADRLDGEPLDLRHGAPFRFVAPAHYGYKSTKHVERIELHVSRPGSPLGRLEHLRARVAREERHPRLAAWIVRWPYRLTVIPTALLAERGLTRRRR